MSTPDALRLAAEIDKPWLVQEHGSKDKAAAELRRQHAEIERLRADAARYRWLRLKVYVCPKEHILRIADTYLKIGAVPEMLDSAIDAAMRDATNVEIEPPRSGRLE